MQSVRRCCHQQLLYLTIGSVNLSSCCNAAPAYREERSLLDWKKLPMKVRAGTVSSSGRKGRSKKGASSASATSKSQYASSAFGLQQVVPLDFISKVQRCRSSSTSSGSTSLLFQLITRLGFVGAWARPSICCCCRLSFAAGVEPSLFLNTFEKNGIAWAKGRGVPGLSCGEVSAVEGIRLGEPRQTLYRSEQ